MEVAADSTSGNLQHKTWCGASISTLCKGKGPLCFAVTPVVVSKYHAVLYQLPVTLKEPPKPYVSNSPRLWDQDHVRMPFSEDNLFPVNEDGVEVAKPRWEVIKNSLSKPINNSRVLEACILKYTGHLYKFQALHNYFDELEDEEVHHFFSELLPKIIKLALQLPEILPNGIPLLKKYYNRSVSLSQLQISCLLANAFLCTFPWRKEVALSYPGINFSRLYMAHSREKGSDSVRQKIQCLIHYFSRVTEKVPVGVVTFERRFKQRSSIPRWDKSDVVIKNTKVHIDSSSTIEDGGLGFLQVDFANKSVGGGVLGYGCVQEEIRFVICPELIASRLFVEKLEDHEAVIVTGPERYSDYSGYGYSFKWNGNVIDPTPYDEYGRKRTSICIIDATHFNRPADQFYPSAMLRELNKAYCGFSSRDKNNLAPVATGNWGCGAFKGDSSLKSLLQLMVCAVCERDLVYYTFGDEDLKNKIYEMYLFLSNNKISVSQLWGFLCGFASKKIPPDNLYSFIQQAFFDSQKQPKIKSFFSVSFKKKAPAVVNDGASTSEAAKKNDENYKIDVKNDGEDNGGEEDEDIIPGTPPPPPMKFEKKKSKPKTKLTSEEIVQKLPKTNIIELIEAIDSGGAENNKKLKDNNAIWNAIEDSFSMELDGEEQPVNNTKICDESKPAKRKITNYFTNLKNS